MPNSTEKWYMKSGNAGDIVISSRVRLARNLKEYPFPDRLTATQRKEVNSKVIDAIIYGGQILSGSLNFIEMDAISDAEAFSMVERHIISPDFAKKRTGRMLVLSKDESISIMLGEEDHIRIQIMCAGLALDDAYKTADQIDNFLTETLSVAFDERLGYLTACPTNLGTGLRASVMLHLPALESCGMMSQLAGDVSKIGLTVRGMYGEGSGSKAALYQLSNQVTLGISEKAALENLKSITAQILGKERVARGSLDPDRLEDLAFRAFGILSSARLLSSEEFMNLISTVRLGISMGILKEASLDTVSSLLIEAQPATLLLCSGAMETEIRDKERAKLVRERLTEKKKL